MHSSADGKEHPQQVSFHRAWLLLLISELKAFLNDDYLGGYTPNRVIILIVVKLVSMWGFRIWTRYQASRGDSS